METTIPIHNLYYLLCYAWDRLDERDLLDVSADTPPRDTLNLLDQAAHVDFGAGHLAGGVEVERRRKPAKGAAFDRLFTGVGPVEVCANAAGQRFVTGPVKFGRPGGGDPRRRR